jgi:dTDP-4-amino-4,6-dideoxygalactose transaminase
VEFSFQAIKQLTTIDGGCLTCKSDDDYRRGKLLRWYGIDREGPRTDMRCELDIEEAGYKWHMNDVAAIIGLEQLYHVDEILQRHRDNAGYYDIEFNRRGIKKCSPLEYNNDRLSSYWLYSILVDDKEKFKKFMEKNGVMVSAVHSRNDIHSCFKQFNTRGLPGVDEFSKRQISIPVGWWISPEDREKVMNAIEGWDKETGNPK